MISVQSVSRVFGDVRALDGVSAVMGAGSVTGLIGSNGSGKSTLLRLMCGIDRPDAGCVECDGLPVYEDPAVKSRIHWIPDDIWMPSGADLADMGAYYRVVYPRFDANALKTAADAFGLEMHRKLNHFSKGMKKQANIALALAARPDVMLCDETFDGLDPKMRQVFRSMLAEAAADGMTVVIASHSLRELEDICDAVLLLHQGKALLQHDLEELARSWCRVQAAFEGGVPDLSALSPVGLKRSGNLVTFSARGDGKEICKTLEAMHPVYAEQIPLTLEEIFIAEMEEIGYAEN